MNPTIISGGTVRDREQELNNLYPTSAFTYTHVTAAKTSILISQIQSLIESLSLTTNTRRLIWLEEANLLTLPAQNALLKILEEPPANTVIVLTLANPQALLATIRSRCLINNLPNKANSPNSANLSLIKSALPLSPGDRILAADALGRKREPLILFTEDCLRALESRLQREKSPKSLHILTQIAGYLHSAHVDLKTNVSPPLVMQNLFLSLPHTRP